MPGFDDTVDDLGFFEYTKEMNKAGYGIVILRNLPWEGAIAVLCDDWNSDLMSHNHRPAYEIQEIEPWMKRNIFLTVPKNDSYLFRIRGKDGVGQYLKTFETVCHVKDFTVIHSLRILDV